MLLLRVPEKAVGCIQDDLDALAALVAERHRIIRRAALGISAPNPPHVHPCMDLLISSTYESELKWNSSLCESSETRFLACVTPGGNEVPVQVSGFLEHVSHRKTSPAHASDRNAFPAHLRPEKHFERMRTCRNASLPAHVSPKKEVLGYDIIFPI